MNRPNCPGSGQPVTQGARVIVTRLRHEQRVGRCASCHQLVLTRDGLAIEHLVATPAERSSAKIFEEPVVIERRTLRERLKGRMQS